MQKIIHIYTDGSCLGNPGPGGWAAILLFDKRKITLKGNAPDTTNNRMEMTAIIETLRYIHEKNLTDAEIKIFSDSNLVIQTLTKHWKKKMNSDLWSLLYELKRGVNINWNWVKAHHEDKYNLEVDRIAVAESEKIQKTSGKCKHCGKETKGKFYLTEKKMLRVDCAHCGRYIKFAPQTKENLKKATSGVRQRLLEI